MMIPATPHLLLAHEHDTYLRRSPRSREHHQVARGVLPGGDTRTIAFWRPYPLYINHGQGCHIWDVDDNRYVDCVNNYTSLILGHAHPRVLRTVDGSVARSTAFAAPMEEQVALAQELVRRVPSCEMVRFCNSGTEATMFAIRATRAFTGRSKIIKAEGGFHGTHDVVQFSVHPPPDQSGPPHAPFTVPESKGLPHSLAAEVLVVPFNDADALGRVLAVHTDDVACVLLEPVMGVAGFIAPKPGYLQAVRDLTSAYGTLLIFDEVQSLRLALGGAQELYGVVPDLTVMAKIIGGGLPIGAFGGRREIMEQFSPLHADNLSHSGTFNGNRASMAAGLAVLEELGTEAIGRINGLGDALRQQLTGALKRAGVRGTVTGVGSLLHIHFVDPPVHSYRDAVRSPPALSAALHLALLNRGIFIAPRGMLNISTAMDNQTLATITNVTEAALLSIRPYIAECWPSLV